MTIRPMIGGTIAALAVLLAACAEPEPSADAVAAEAVAAAPPPIAPYLSPTTLVTLDGGDTAPFGYVGDAVTGPDGSVFIADFQGRAIHRFDVAGSHIATIGGQGRGPGEFEAISAIAISADTVFAWDPVIWRISAFDAEGTLIMAERVEPRRQSGWPTTVARIGDGSWLYLDQEIVGLNDEGVEVDNDIIRAVARLVRWSPQSDAWSEIAEVPGMQAGLARSEAGEPSLVTAPFPRGPLWAPDRAGGWWYADNGAYIVTRYSTAGDTLGRIVVGMQGPLVTDADRESFISADGRLEASSPQSQIRAGMPMPERRPVLLDLLTSQQGDLWVGIDAGVPDSVEWHAFGADHRMRFRLRLPALSELLHISGDTLLVVTRDALDVQTVDKVVIR